jgi:Copper amine oxidase N-terminal domain
MRLRGLGIVVLVAVALVTASHVAADQVGPVFQSQYFWVIKGHDVAGTGLRQAGVTPYLSPEDWVVGRPAYRGNGGPQAVRRLPGGKRAPMGRTPTERTGKVRVTAAGVGLLGAQAVFSATSRLAQVSYQGKMMVLLPGSRTALLDGSVVTLSDTPALRGGQLYLPLGDVAQRLLGITDDEAVARISRSAP